MCYAVSFHSVGGGLPPFSATFSARKSVLFGSTQHNFQQKTIKSLSWNQTPCNGKLISWGMFSIHLSVFLLFSQSEEVRGLMSSFPHCLTCTVRGWGYLEPIPFLIVADLVTLNCCWQLIATLKAEYVNIRLCRSEVFAWLFLLYFYNVNIYIFSNQFQTFLPTETSINTHIQWSFAPIPKCEHRVQHEVHNKKFDLMKPAWPNGNGWTWAGHLVQTTLTV